MKEYAQEVSRVSDEQGINMHFPITDSIQKGLSVIVRGIQRVIDYEAKTPPDEHAALIDTVTKLS